jgi:hypothetical protein
MIKKVYKLSNFEELVPNIGGCLATDMITVEGFKVGYMYREHTNRELDSGWRFFSGAEDQDYIDDLNNSSVYDLNTIANYDKAIIPYLEMPFGTELERVENSDLFRIILD